LETEFEQLWLAAPVGLFALADTFGGDGKFDDGARLAREILRKIFCGLPKSREAK
jgi:hypothetical protein